jgi:hypothetical protein
MPEKQYTEGPEGRPGDTGADLVAAAEISGEQALMPLLNL